MGSLYLTALSADDRKTLIRKLLEAQKGKCFICEKKLDPDLHGSQIDIDHVEPLKVGGKDDPTNFAATHASCNRSKQASDLRVARVLARFAAIKDAVSEQGRGPNLGDVLERNGGAKYELALRRSKDSVELSFPETGNTTIYTVQLYRDHLSDLDYFFVKAPIEYLFHDDRINPRAIGGSLNGLVEEFHRKRPQLHVALAWAELDGEVGNVRLAVFDGQHKATAQVILGVRELPIRVFLNPNLDVLLTTHTNAGTTLRQIAFDKSVQRHLGSALFRDRIDRYRRDRGLPDTAESFSEEDLVVHFRGERREMQRYILDAVRDGITHSPDNKLKDYIEFGGKGKERPLSYSSIEKTFYWFFIYKLCRARTAESLAKQPWGGRAESPQESTLSNDPAVSARTSVSTSACCDPAHSTEGTRRKGWQRDTGRSGLPPRRQRGSLPRHPSRRGSRRRPGS